MQIKNLLGITIIRENMNYSCMCSYTVSHPIDSRLHQIQRYKQLGTACVCVCHSFIHSFICSSKLNFRCSKFYWAMKTEKKRFIVFVHFMHDIYYGWKIYEQSNCTICHISHAMDRLGAAHNKIVRQVRCAHTPIAVWLCHCSMENYYDCFYVSMMFHTIKFAMARCIGHNN